MAGGGVHPLGVGGVRYRLARTDGERHTQVGGTAILGGVGPDGNGYAGSRPSTDT
jgi:hypothetical protein